MPPATLLGSRPLLRGRVTASNNPRAGRGSEGRKNMGGRKVRPRRERASTYEEATQPDARPG